MNFSLQTSPPLHSASLPTPHICVLPWPSPFLGGKIRWIPLKPRNGRHSPTLLPPPHNTAGGGGEVSRVHKGQMLRRKRAVPDPHPPTPPPPPAKEKLKETAFKTNKTFVVQNSFSRESALCKH